jgi:hypothetical protein
MDDDRNMRVKTDRRNRALVFGLVAFGAYNLGQGIFMAVAPGTFFSEVGPFGIQNDHYIRDLASFYGAVGAALLVAVRYRAWRVPVLALLTLQFALHAVNHLIDIDEADPSWLGVVDFAALVGGIALLAGLLKLAVRRPGHLSPDMEG